jgi:serine/threonine protein kinase
MEGSELLLDLVGRMLELDPSKRISPALVLKHQFLS